MRPGLGTPRGANGSHVTDCYNGTTPWADTNMTTLPLKPWAPLPFTDDDANAGNWTWRQANMTLADAPGVPALGGDGHIGNLGPLTFSNGTTLLSYTIRSGQFKQSFGLAVGSTPHGPFAPRTGDWGAPVVTTHGEDSFLWQDKRGNFHLLYHVGGATGGHAFSRDAWSWRQSQGQAYTATVSSPACSASTRVHSNLALLIFTTVLHLSIDTRCVPTRLLRRLGAAAGSRTSGGAAASTLKRVRRHGPSCQNRWVSLVGCSHGST